MNLLLILAALMFPSRDPASSCRVALWEQGRVEIMWVSAPMPSPMFFATFRLEDLDNGYWIIVPTDGWRIYGDTVFMPLRWPFGGDNWRLSDLVCFTSSHVWQAQAQDAWYRWRVFYPIVKTYLRETSPYPTPETTP